MLKWRNFRLTPLELLIVVLIILGVIFLISTWNQGGENNNQLPVSSPMVWEQAMAASEQSAQLAEKMRAEIAALQKTIQDLEKRLQILERNKPGAAPVRSQAQYTVKSGDTLQSIAQANDVSLAELRAWNKLPPNSLLKVGQKLNLAPSR